MQDHIFSILNKHLEVGDTLILGLSAGPDSVCLLHLLCEYAKKKPLNIVVAHMNHGIRGSEAFADEALAKKLAKNCGARYEFKRISLKEKTHQEERGRTERRIFFEELAEKYSAKFILTAHTQDDQVETIVMNFIRGGGPAGLGGMRVTNGKYFKPFLGVAKKEILKYLDEKKMAYRKDKTNEDTKYRRNFVRKEIVPMFEQCNASFRQTLLRNAEVFRALDDFLYEAAQAFLMEQKKEEVKKDRFFLFRAKEFKNLPKALQEAVIECAFQKWTGQSYRLPAVRVKAVLDLIHRGIGKKKIPLGRLGKNAAITLLGGRVKIEE